jgi:hypothetical protein
MKVEQVHRILEAKTRRWWFFVIVITIGYIPPFSSRNFELVRFMNILRTTLGNSIYYSCKPAFPVFQTIAIVMLILLACFPTKMSKTFTVYASLCYLLFNIQNIAITEKYGISVVTMNVILFSLVAAAWAWEAVIAKNDVSRIHQPFWKFIILAVALFAFWSPISPNTGKADFNALYFLTSGSALTFCMMTPVFLAVLIFFYPNVNQVTLRVTGLVGTAIGLVNVIPKLILHQYSTWWDGFLHLPLLLLSILGMALSMRKIQSIET